MMKLNIPGGFKNHKQKNAYGFLSLSLNLILIVSYVHAGGGIVNHVNVTV